MVYVNTISFIVKAKLVQAERKTKTQRVNIKKYMNFPYRTLSTREQLQHLPYQRAASIIL